MKKNAIRVILADDHPIFRDGLRRVLQAESGIDVVAEASDGLQAVLAVRENPADILLLDYTLPKSNGIEVLRELKSAGIEIKVIMLTADMEDGEMVKALHLGARGIVLKHTAPTILIKSLRSVFAGEYWVEREIMAMWAQSDKDSGSRAELTLREREVMDKVMAGCSNRDIAEQLSISQDTVKRHLTHIYEKQGVANRLELALHITSQRAAKPK